MSDLLGNAVAAVENAADKNETQSAEARAARERRRYLSYLLQVLKTPAGRAVVWEQLEYCRVLMPVHHENPHQMYLNEGRRQVGLRLMADINEADPNVLVSMMADAAAEQARQTLEQEQERKRKEDLERTRGYDGADIY